MFELGGWTHRHYKAGPSKRMLRRQKIALSFLLVLVFGSDPVGARPAGPTRFARTPKIQPEFSLLEERGSPEALSTCAPQRGARTRTVHIPRRGGLKRALRNAGLRKREIRRVLRPIAQNKQFRDIRRGAPIEINRTRRGRVRWLKIRTSPLSALCVERNRRGRYFAVAVGLKPTVKIVSLHGIAKPNLITSLSYLGERRALAHNFADIFEGQVRLIPKKSRRRRRQRIDRGEFSLVFEKIFVGNEFVDYGRILAAEYKSKKGRVHRAFYYDSPGGDSGYYSEKGKALHRTRLSSPVPPYPVSSKFGRRRHPILRRWRMHNGVDYGAPEGTGIHAFDSGRISFYLHPDLGKTLIIKHQNGLKTRYAHLSGVSPEVYQGKFVKRGELIGFVGATGLATGAHLHFEAIRNGRYLNPQRLRRRIGRNLKKRDRQDFNKIVSQRLRQLDQIRSTDREPQEVAQLINR